MLFLEWETFFFGTARRKGGQRSYGELNASGGFHMSSRAGGDDSNRALSNRSIRYGVGPESDCSREEPGNGVGEARRTC
jgi:hypothetical protein